eukprot:CAMPEP_0114047688 /NCGR_PEP_ID=MMETSP1339-20121228/35201_1 /TAXON_ID=94617 /ORGANISM="Fibrocapsa japonica" /LENGTH=33 /assembly_acc=CAM_ASM_000762
MTATGTSSEGILSTYEAAPAPAPAPAPPASTPS